MIYFNNIINIFLFLYLKNQIEILKNDLNQLLRKYTIFNFKLIDAKKLGIYLNDYDKNLLIRIIELLCNEFKMFNDSQKIKEDIFNSNKNIIIKKQEHEIDKLKEKLSKYPFELSNGEKLISIIFTSSDQNMHYSIICKNTQKFIELEQKLYKDYPEYSKSDNYFMINGNKVNKDKSLDENKIRNSDIIILTQNDI